MTLSTGSRLGPYEILAPIGAGGMGEVYKAKDTRLERTVAVKVLPQHLSSSAEVRQRFEREAKTISQLSHPHICALYDVGREGENEYLVMEYLEGETLLDRLGKGSLPLSQTLKFGVEIADALDKAHRQGIVHRDLKPGNVMLTRTGVKLLDFGLAKAMAPAAPPSALTSMPTQHGLTQEGTILGTFQYMAPEQLEGREADGRTDIFAFGCVLYEMATGKKAFSGSSQASLISSIMKEEPAPVSTVLPTTPAALDRVIRKALSKDPEDRWQSAGDLGSELKWIAEGGSASGIAAPAVLTSRRKRLAWLPWAAALVLAAAGLAAGRLLQSAPETSVTRSSIDLPPELDLDRWTSPAISPDGSTLVFAATGSDRKRQLWIRRMDGFAVQPLPGTDEAMGPFWSPDGRSIGFFAARKLKRIPAAGGTVQTICDASDGRGASWSVDDVIVLAPAPFGGLFRVPATGGAPVAVTKVEGQGRTHRLPWFLPDGKHLLYLDGTQTSDVDQNTTIQVLDLATGKSTLVAKEKSEGRFVEPGYLAFLREGNLLAQPFDRKSLKTTGPALPVAEGVAFEAFRWVGKFALSNTGRLVYQSNEAIRRSRLAWFDVDGKPLGSVGEAANFFTVRLSPDDRRVIATVMGDKNTRPEIRLYDLERGVGSRFTFGEQGANFPSWSPDGKSIAYGDPGSGVRIKAADGGSESKLILPQKANIWPLSWSADGKRMLLRIQDNKGGGVDLWDLPLEGEMGPPTEGRPPAVGDAGRRPAATQPRLLFPTDPDELENGSISRDGKWLLYVSNETGRREVYVVPYPGLGEKRQVSTAGADSGIWLGDKAILYEQPPDGRLFAVDVDVEGGGLRLGAPRPVFGGKPPPRGPFDATRDGKRLLFAVPDGNASSAQIRFVSDWRADLGETLAEANFPKVPYGRDAFSRDTPDVGLAAGTKLGPYKILAHLGAGGMGEVYRARDERLGRDVAIKVLPEAVARDADRLRRFEQEARSASALNHPSIVTIYDVGQTDGVSWIAMELVEGVSLRQLLAGGALTAKRTLAIGAQIASGLAKAHASAIVHRDLKPENVMVTPEGLAKILDFGLAKATPLIADDSQVATVAPQTDAGVVLGTVGYMSPEQATGRAVDYRSDQFALGAILYEMASGRRAFQRATPIETLSAILKEEPSPLSSSGSEAPEALGWIVERCLAKEPEERYQSTRDLAQDLAAARDRAPSASASAPAATVRPGPSPSRRTPRMLTLAVLAVAAVGAFIVVRGRARPAAPGTVQSLAVLPLKSLGGDAADEALGLGIADTIIRGLSGAGAIPVRPLSAVRRYAKSDADAVTVAKELKTDAVLEGSVQRAGGKLRVTVNLLRVGDGVSLWAESFDVPASEVFEVQDAVSDAVVSRLRLHLDPGQRDRLKKRFTQSPEAYQEFVLARSVEGKAGPGWGGEHLDAAVRHYERAVALDPGYALAHARLALAYLWRDLFFKPGAGDLEKGKAAVAEAERLDPQLAETHQFRYQLAWSHYQDFDIPAALRELRAARKLDPLTAHDELAILYAHIGLDGPFRRESARGLEIDPSSDVTKRFSVEGLVLLGHAEEAVAMLKERGLPAAESRLPMSLISLGRFDEARAATDALLREAPNHHQAVAMRELVAVVSKERPADEAALARALESGKLKRDYHHTTYAVACIRAAQGDNPRAVDMLRRTVATGMPDRTLFLADPLLARVRPSREFAAFDAEFEPNWRRLEKEATGD